MKRVDVPVADEEVLLRENDDLVHWVIGTFKPTFVLRADYDDIAQVGRIALLKAIRTYEPKKGKLSTYATRCIRNAYRNMLFLERAQKRQTHKLQVYYDEEIDDKGHTWWDTLEMSASVEDEVVRRVAMQEWLAQLDERERCIIEMKCQGYYLREIGARLGITHERVRQIIRGTEEKARELGLIS